MASVDWGSRRSLAGSCHAVWPVALGHAQGLLCRVVREIRTRLIRSCAVLGSG